MSETKSARGRPRREMTRAQIADAGIAMGLPAISIVGVAAALGVSHMTLYTYVSSLDELKQLVADEIFLRWPLQEPQGEPLKDYMEAFGISMWHLVEKHPGIAPYLLREDLITPAMRAKISDHQHVLMRAYNLSFKQAHWLFLTVAHVCVAVADTLIPRDSKLHAATAGQGINAGYASGVHALITGALIILDEIENETTDQSEI